MRSIATSLALVASLALLGCGSEDDDDPRGDDPAPDAGVAQVDAGPPADAGETQPDAGGAITFMEACDPSDDQCDVDLVCFNFNSRGPHCTHSCTLDADCEEPSRGCNNMGLCKAP